MDVYGALSLGVTHRRSGGGKGWDQRIEKRDSGVETRTKAAGKAWREYGREGGHYGRSLWERRYMTMGHG